MRVDIHNSKRKLETTLLRLKEYTLISENNKSAILRFSDDCLAGGITPGRIVRCLTDMMNIAKVLNKDFSKANLEDIKRVISGIEQKDWSEWTKYGVKVTLKKFYKVFNNSDTYPDIVKWIKPRIKNGRIKMPEDLLTEDDIKKLVNAASNPRDKALIMTIYESGCRIGEILPLELKHVHFDEYGAQLMVNGKTGQRRVRVIAATPFLAEWINKHPINEPNSPLWWVNNAQGLRYGTIVKHIKEIAVRANIKKRVNPHSFRHSRATYLANHLTEAQMKEHFGWVQGSDMASVYVHLSGRDVDSALLKTYGLSTTERKHGESDLKPKSCPRCNEVNQMTNQFCSKCGMIIDEQARNKIIETELKGQKANAILDKMLQNEAFKKAFEDEARKHIIADS